MQYQSLQKHFISDSPNCLVGLPEAFSALLSTSSPDGSGGMCMLSVPPGGKALSFTILQRGSVRGPEALLSGTSSVTVSLTMGKKPKILQQARVQPHNSSQVE